MLCLTLIVLTLDNGLEHHIREHLGMNFPFKPAARVLCVGSLHILPTQNQTQQTFVWKNRMPEASPAEGTVRLLPAARVAFSSFQSKRWTVAVVMKNMTTHCRHSEHRIADQGSTTVLLFNKIQLHPTTTLHPLTLLSSSTVMAHPTHLLMN